MTPVKMSGLGAVLIALWLSAAGCCENEKNQIRQLSGDLTTANNTLTEVRAELASVKAREDDLLQQVAARDAEILKLKGAAGTTKGPTTGEAAGGGKVATGWEATTFGDKITVGSDILFAAGKAALTTAGHNALNKVVADLKSTYAGLPVRVYGFTDSDPIQKTKNLWQDNLDLSANRAMAVTRYLISKGVPADRIETIGMGATHPVASNAKPEGKAKNRRVEIFVIKSKAAPAAGKAY